MFQVTRLISLAAQKFISDISYEALQHCKMRGGGKDQKSKSSGRDRKPLSTSNVRTQELSLRTSWW